jgi:hypothetical protein
MQENYLLAKRLSANQEFTLLHGDSHCKLILCHQYRVVPSRLYACVISLYFRLCDIRKSASDERSDGKLKSLPHTAYSPFNWNCLWWGNTCRSFSIPDVIPRTTFHTGQIKEQMFLSLPNDKQIALSKLFLFSGSFI